ncbi:MAG: response regulator [bacterium]|jgi:DNA-binding response OmpR family regulator/glycine cleavage system H lipoate-binding protein|nr:response regulator [bacterium]
MIANKKILVVDDEAVVCQSCSRIFSSKGITTDTSTDSRIGLKMATENDYAAILLDIKMPEMDGIEFLENLRKEKQDIPVMMITGYSSIPSAAAAMRLGASDYIPKPFSPDEIIAAVERILQEKTTIEETTAAADSIHASSHSDFQIRIPSTPDNVVPIEAETERFASKARHQTVSASGQLLFQKDAWVRIGCKDSVRVGAFQSLYKGKQFTCVSLPQVGDQVYRGLPIAQFEIPGEEPIVIHSPVTGEIAAVNSALAQNVNTVWMDPCHDAWIAIVHPESLEEDLQACQSRNVILATAQTGEWEKQISLLTGLGCQVHHKETLDGIFEILVNTPNGLVFLDSATFGISGPHLVRQINAKYPDAKVIVLRDLDNCREAEYRLCRIFYYTVEPFSGPELIDVLHSAFSTSKKNNTYYKPSRCLPNTIGRISIINPHGKSVALLPFGEVLTQDKGLGRALAEKILGSGLPLKIELSKKEKNLEHLIHEAKQNDKVLILETRNINRISGTVQHDFAPSVRMALGENQGKVQQLSIQPSLSEEGPTVFDDDTTNALTDFILREMVI